MTNSAQPRFSYTTCATGKAIADLKAPERVAADIPNGETTPSRSINGTFRN